MRVPDILTRQLLFVVGKGGVGKTTIAASLADLASRCGKKVLLVEVDGKGSIAEVFGGRSMSYHPSEVQTNLFVMEMDTDEALSEYLRVYLKVPFSSRLPGLGRIFDFVATAAPGVRDVLVMGKLCYEAKEGDWDVIVVDSPASGHVISQLGIAQGVGQLMSLGLVRTQTEWMDEILGSRSRTGAVLVATAESTPVEEALELAERLAEETPVGLLGAVINRVIPEIFGDAEAESFESLRELKLESLQGVQAALDLYRRLAARHQQSADFMADSLGGDVPIVTVPEYFARVAGRELVDEVSEGLEVDLW